MGKQLSYHERQKALQAILPEQIYYPYGDNELTHFSELDVGRGMLNNDKYGLIETLQGFENIYGTGCNEINSRILPSGIDNIILSFSLKAFLLSKENSNSGDIALLVPPFSYAYPLFLSYHLIFQHLGESLSPLLGARFDESQGILIITDNIELHSHVWRTSVAGAHLREYINTYTVEAGSFKEFNFNKNNNKKSDDGSLPWIAFFRAVRHILPEVIEKRPGIIIVDLLPYRHRKRADDLISWAKRNSKHVIVVGPLHEEGVIRDITATIQNILPIDHFNLRRLKNTFGVKEIDSFNPITACWNLNASTPFISYPANNFSIYKISGIEILEKLISKGYMLISNARTADGKKPKAFIRLVNLLSKLCSLPIPLEWYERSRRANRQPTIEELIFRAAKIPPESYEEKVIIKNLLPQLLNCINEIYSILKQQNGSPMAEALAKLISQFRDEKSNITVVVDDETLVIELKTWLKYIGVNGSQLANLHVTTQGEWAKNQLKEIYLDQDAQPQKVIITRPWRPKYISSFFFSDKTEILFIALSNEIAILINQLKKIFEENKFYKEKLVEICYNFFKISKINDIVNRRIDVTVREIQVSPSQKKEQYHKTDSANVDSLFDENILIDMMSDNDIDDEVMLENEKIEVEQLLHRINDSPVCKAIKITVRDFNQPEQNSSYFCLIERDVILKIKKFNEEHVDDVHPLELQPGDIWVKLKKHERRELFDTVLDLASNTLVMKWIQINIQEWKEMLNLLWHKYHFTNRSRSETYDKILQDVRKNGGTISSRYAVASWIKGSVTLVRDEKTVRAVALALGEKHFIDRSKLIYKAMRQLWTIHIQLGKALGKLIMDQAASISRYNQQSSKWIDLGSEIRIAFEDVLDVLELKEIMYIEKDVMYKVPQNVLYKNIDENTFNNLLMKGMIRYVE